MLSSAASETNRVIKLSDDMKKKPRRHPAIKQAQLKLTDAQNLWACSTNEHSRRLAGEARSAARMEYRQAIRMEQQQDCDKRDTNIHKILSSNPSNVFSSIRGFKSTEASINKLKVGDKIYNDDQVPDGFFDSLSSLKSPDMSNIEATHEYQSTLSDYVNIVKICSEGRTIPAITPQHSMKILLNLKPNVSDLYSITPHHFIHAGPEGHQHFHHLLSLLVNDINLSSLEEFNSVYAKLLYKGHNKDKTNHRSWRTISNCPVLAKALDT